MSRRGRIGTGGLATKYVLHTNQASASIASAGLEVSAWTFAVELNGVQEQLAFTPQARKALTRTGARDRSRRSLPD